MSFKYTIVVLLTTILLVLVVSGQRHVLPVSKLVDDCCCTASVVDASNNKEINPILNDIAKQRFFRYFKVNIFAECPHWVVNQLCGLGGCSVCECEDHEIPEPWKKEDMLKNRHDEVDATNKELPSDFKKWIDKGDAMWVADDGPETELSYINLVQHAEKHTGYDGNNVWQAVYGENCFAKKVKEMCQEERVFYKLISGLHTSISTHIAYYYDENNNGDHSQNADVYVEKVGKHPERIENLYFTYLFLLRAITKIKPRLQEYSFDTGDAYEDSRTKTLVQSLLKHEMVCFPKFDESTMFESTLEKAELKEQLRSHFQNISTIFNCISCETCKLYGKLQILGIGTALKILFEENGDQIERDELIAIINTLRQVSNSIKFIQELDEKANPYVHDGTTNNDNATFLTWLMWRVVYLLLSSVIGLVVWKVVCGSKNKKH